MMKINHSPAPALNNNVNYSNLKSKIDMQQHTVSRVHEVSYSLQRKAMWELIDRKTYRLHWNIFGNGWFSARSCDCIPRYATELLNGKHRYVAFLSLLVILEVCVCREKNYSSPKLLYNYYYIILYYNRAIAWIVRQAVQMLVVMDYLCTESLPFLSFRWVPLQLK